MRYRTKVRYFIIDFNNIDVNDSSDYKKATGLFLKDLKLAFKPYFELKQLIEKNKEEDNYKENAKDYRMV